MTRSTSNLSFLTVVGQRRSHFPFSPPAALFQSKANVFTKQWVAHVKSNINPYNYGVSNVFASNQKT